MDADGADGGGGMEEEGSAETAAPEASTAGVPFSGGGLSVSFGFSAVTWEAVESAGGRRADRKGPQS
jgi:hypothetical protein